MFLKCDECYKKENLKSTCSTSILQNVYKFSAPIDRKVKRILKRHPYLKLSLKLDTFLCVLVWGAINCCQNKAPVTFRDLCFIHHLNLKTTKTCHLFLQEI